MLRQMITIFASPLVPAGMNSNSQEQATAASRHAPPHPHSSDSPLSSPSPSTATAMGHSHLRVHPLPAHNNHSTVEVPGVPPQTSKEAQGVPQTTPLSTSTRSRGGPRLEVIRRHHILRLGHRLRVLRLNSNITGAGDRPSPLQVPRKDGTQILRNRASFIKVCVGVSKIMCSLLMCCM